VVTWIKINYCKLAKPSYNHPAKTARLFRNNCRLNPRAHHLQFIMDRLMNHWVPDSWTRIYKLSNMLLTPPLLIKQPRTWWYNLQASSKRTNKKSLTHLKEFFLSRVDLAPKASYQFKCRVGLLQTWIWWTLSNLTSLYRTLPIQCLLTETTWTDFSAKTRWVRLKAQSTLINEIWTHNSRSHNNISNNNSLCSTLLFSKTKLSLWEINMLSLTKAKNWLHKITIKFRETINIIKDLNNNLSITNLK